MPAAPRRDVSLSRGSLDSHLSRQAAGSVGGRRAVGCQASWPRRGGAPAARAAAGLLAPRLAGQEEPLSVLAARLCRQPVGQMLRGSALQ